MPLKILIVKTSSLGDIIHAFPVIDFLHQRFPKCQIDWVVEEPFSELLTSHPFIAHVYKIHTKQWRKGKNWKDIFYIRRQLKSAYYDVVFDLQGNSKSAIFTYWANSVNKVGYGPRLVFEKPNLWVTTHQFDPPHDANVREENLHLVREFFSDRSSFYESKINLSISLEQHKHLEAIFQSLPEMRKVMVCPGSAWINKRLEKKVLIQFLSRIPNTHFVLIWGTDEEKRLVLDLQNHISESTIIDKLPISVLQNLMGMMDEVIAMDSFPLHLAAITKVPTYSIFGASSALKYKPIGDQHRAFQGSCPYGKKFSRRCSLIRSCKTGACIQSLSPENLLDHYQSH